MPMKITCSFNSTIIFYTVIFKILINILDVKARTEGGLKVVISTRVERDSTLRRKAIQLHGTKCKVCDFDFTKTYGNWANDYIEVHHMKLLSKAKETTIETNPSTDLTVVCSNCHRMIHKKRDLILTSAATIVWTH
jgi:5-methylcytosine-specific restriction protein A